MMLPKLNAGVSRGVVRDISERGVRPSGTVTDCTADYKCYNSTGGYTVGAKAGTGNDMSSCCQNAISSANGACSSPYRCEITSCS